MSNSEKSENKSWKSKYSESITGVTKREEYNAPEPTHNLTISSINELEFIRSNNWDSLSKDIQFVISKFGLKYNSEVARGSASCIFTISSKKDATKTFAYTIPNSAITNKEWSKVALAIQVVLNNAGINGNVGYRIRGKFVEFFI